MSTHNIIQIFLPSSNKGDCIRAKTDRLAHQSTNRIGIVCDNSIIGLGLGRPLVYFKLYNQTFSYGDKFFPKLIAYVDTLSGIYQDPVYKAVRCSNLTASLKSLTSRFFVLLHTTKKKTHFSYLQPF